MLPRGSSLSAVVVGLAGRRYHASVMRSSGGASTIAVVVVGGGIAGAFSAFFLARAGADVTLIEREEIAGQASGNNPGGLNPLYGPGIPGPLQALAPEAFGLHLEHWDEIRRTGIEFDGHTRMNLAHDRGLGGLKWLLRRGTRTGADPAILEDAESRAATSVLWRRPACGAG